MSTSDADYSYIYWSATVLITRVKSRLEGVKGLWKNIMGGTRPPVSNSVFSQTVTPLHGPLWMLCGGVAWLFRSGFRSFKYFFLDILIYRVINILYEQILIKYYIYSRIYIFVFIFIKKSLFITVLNKLCLFIALL